MLGAEFGSGLEGEAVGAGGEDSSEQEEGLREQHVVWIGWCDCL